MALFASVIGSAYPASVFPISTVTTPDGVPLAVIVGMESKPGHFVAFQLDTGASTSLLFETPGKSRAIDERVMQLSTHSAKPVFLGDSGKRARIRLSSEHTQFDEIAALVSVPRPATGIVGVLGLDWFRDKVVRVLFDKQKMQIVEGSDSTHSSKTLISFNLDLKTDMSRIGFDICRPHCQSIIFDTGLTIADIVEFVPMRVLVDMGVTDDVVQIPGVLGPVMCRKPIKSAGHVLIGGKKVAGLYQTVCAFVESPDAVPDRAVMGIRSIIEMAGSILIDLKSNRVELDYRRPHLHDD